MMDKLQNSNLLNMAKRNVALSAILVILAVIKIILPICVLNSNENFLYDIYMLENKIGPLLGAFSLLLLIFSFSLYRKIKHLFYSLDN